MINWLISAPVRKIDSKMTQAFEYLELQYNMLLCASWVYITEYNDNMLLSM